jgi:predicted acylesterase/phospholipase RssA
VQIFSKGWFTVPKLKKRILVLSGGGAKIGFQAGVTSSIKRNFDAVIGVSCGAIWAAMIAQNKQYADTNIILLLNNDKIFTGSFSLWNIAKKLILGKTYLLDTSPLRKLLEANVRKADFVIPAYFVYVDAVTGEKITACSDDLDTRGIIDAIMASAAIPVVMEGGKDMNSFKSMDDYLDPNVPKGIKNRYFDGGLEETCPLGEAIALQPDEIVIVNCFNRDGKAKLHKGNLLGIASWAFTDKMPGTIANNSVDTFLMVNEILKATSRDSVTIMWKGKTKVIKRFDCELYEPEINLGDSLDFSRESMLCRYKHGINVAEAHKK